MKFRPTLLVVTLLPVLLLGASARMWVEWQWFEQFGWGTVLLRRWLLQGLGLVRGAGALGGSAGLDRLAVAPAAAGPGDATRFALAPFPYLVVLIVVAASQLLSVLLLLRPGQAVFNPFDPRRLHGLVGLTSLLAALILVLLVAGGPAAAPRGPPLRRLLAALAAGRPPWHWRGVGGSGAWPCWPRTAD